MTTTSTERAMTRERNQAIARAILAQLGGQRFAVMTGARQLLAIDSGLRFRIPAASDKINLVKVTLAADDTYTVEFYTVRGTSSRTVAAIDGLYADGLARVFTDRTGLHTGLGSN